MIETNPAPESIQLAYDRIAPGYDRQVAGDDWMRQRLWQRYSVLFQPGDHVLDIACGTGVDAVYLAGTGVRVTAIDISPEMIAHCRTRAAQAELEDRIDTFVLDHAAIDQFPAASFDGIISAFAGLNTSPDLAHFAREAARLLRPNGHLLVHMLNRVSLWEWLGLMAHGRWHEARSLGDAAERTFTIGGLPVAHRLYYPLDAYEQFFASNLRLERAYALGVLRPPHNLRWVPASLARLLGSIEQRLGTHRPWLDRGRFFVLELVKRSFDEDAG